MTLAEAIKLTKLSAATRKANRPKWDRSIAETLLAEIERLEELLAKIERLQASLNAKEKIK